ncbi:MAG TPA: RDD family protein [Geothrix sp.]|nr:RDD family protein [Geothrix sp.]
MHLPRPDFTSRTFEALALDRHQELEGLPLASFRQRAMAISLDWVLVFLIWLLLLAGVGGLLVMARVLHFQHNTVITLNRGVGAWTFPPMALLYFGLGTWAGKGRTLGKRWMRIRVVSLHGHDLHLWTCVERFLGYGASTLEFGFGFLQYFLHPNRQTVHDRIAETIVVKEPRES